jgi:hypothetical protein
MEHDLSSYIHMQLDKGPTLVRSKRKVPILLRTVWARNNRRASADPRLVSALLEQGADPNEQFNGVSVWAIFARAIALDHMEVVRTPSFSRSLEESLDRGLQFAEAFLSHGANVNEGIEIDGTTVWEAITTRCQVVRMKWEWIAYFRLLTLFLQHGADPNTVYHRSTTGITVWERHLDRCYGGTKPFETQITHSLVITHVGIMLEWGANPDARGSGHTDDIPLSVDDVIERISDHGAKAKMRLLVSDKRLERLYRDFYCMWILVWACKCVGIRVYIPASPLKIGRLEIL